MIEILEKVLRIEGKILNDREITLYSLAVSSFVTITTMIIILSVSSLFVYLTYEENIFSFKSFVLLLVVIYFLLSMIIYRVIMDWMLCIRKINASRKGLSKVKKKIERRLDEIEELEKIKKYY
jgi:flagellar biosynthesis protein FlhB